MGSVSFVDWLLRLLTSLSRAQKLVLMGFEHVVRLLAHFWLYFDDSTIVHQLQIEIGSSSSLANVNVQIFKHFH